MIVSSSNSNGLKIVSWQIQEEPYHIKRTDKKGNTYYYNKNNQRHRTEGPAIEWADGDKFWYINDKFIGSAMNGFTEVDFENYKREYNITSNLKFSSDDPAFDDYDTRDTERKRNDFFLYDKDMPGGKDALHLQEIWNTDLMYLEDTQREEKERDAFDWTGRENLQLGFSSLKFSWQIQEPEINMRVEVIKELIKYNDELSSGIFIVEVGTKGRILNILDKHDLINVILENEVSILVDKDTFFDDFKEINNKESSLKFSVDTYFDSSPAELNPVEESKLVHPIDDKKLRRTNPKRFDQRHDWYQESDSDISNRYDNAIQGDASLKFSWQIQEPTVGMHVEVIKTIKKTKNTRGSNFVISVGTKAEIISFLDKYNLVNLQLLPDYIGILVDRDTFFEYFKEIPKESSLKFAVDTIS